MRSLRIKILLGGLAVLLAMVACSTVSPSMPTIATLPPAPVVTDTATPIPATAISTVPAAIGTDTSVPATPAALPTLPSQHRHPSNPCICWTSITARR